VRAQPPVQHRLLGTAAANDDARGSRTQHTDEVLRALGYGDQQIAALREQGIV
jgi:hypothetical protein